MTYRWKDSFRERSHGGTELVMGGEAVEGGGASVEVGGMVFGFRNGSFSTFFSFAPIGLSSMDPTNLLYVSART